MSEEVTLCRSDTAVERAEKIWRLMGFDNELPGQQFHLARALDAYMRLDAKARQKQSAGGECQ